MRKLRINVISESEFTVQGHGVHTAYLELTNALRRRDDCEIVVNKNDAEADILHFHTYGFYALMRLFSNKGKKVVSAHLVPDSFVGSLRAGRLVSFIAKRYLNFFYSRADLLLPVSDYVAKTLRETMRVDPRKMHTLYNSVDMSKYAASPDAKYAARAKLGIKQGQKVVVGNGQVQPRKRVDVMVEVAKKMPNIQFIWVGGIPFKGLAAEYGAMKELMKSLPDNMTVTGILPLDKVKAYYHAADVFMLPAMQENHPLCVLEAAGAGLPIILRDIPEYKDAFQDDVYYAKNDTDFQRCIANLLRDKKLSEKYIKSAELIARRFDSSTAADQFVKLCQKIIK